MPTHYCGNEAERRALNLFIALARGSESFFARLFAAVANEGLTPSQFGVLETLYHLGPLTASQIAQKHLRSRNNLSVVISNLEREGLIVRKSCPNDRRSHFIELTDHGRSTIESLLPKFVARLVQEVQVLSPEEQEMAKSLLKKLGIGQATD